MTMTETDQRVPVYAVWDPTWGAGLGLGMITVYARTWEDGALTATYDVHRIMDPEALYQALSERQGPAVLLVSNYMWSVRENRKVAEEAKRLNPDLFIFHGGPSTPKYEPDVEDFFATYGDLVDVTARGEGEGVVVGVLAALEASVATGRFDHAPLAAVDGITFRDPETGSLVRTPERERIADLDTIPSPYLNGEFADINPSAITVIETNRGCPYGCTFCDWGSATLSRLRKFDMDRVEAEMRWCAQQELPIWMIADANFGIFARDVEIAERLANVKREFGFPISVSVHVAKNTTRHMVKIIDTLVGAGIRCHTALSLQSRDEQTLATIERKNISADHYAKLAAELRQRGLPVVGDLMLGLPGQTAESYRLDLQFLLDHEIVARTWLTQVLPNAPMNEPSYRQKFQLKTDSRKLLVSTSTYTEEDRTAMIRLRHAYFAFEHFGMARHLLRYLQWDLGIEASEVMQRAVDITESDPERYPLITLVLRYFDLVTITPFGWGSFNDEMRDFVITEFGVAPSSALDTAIAVQRTLMPDWDRSFPIEIELEHDYVAYYEDGTRPLFVDGIPSAPERRLEEYPPGSFTVLGDPEGFCANAPMRPWVRDESYVSSYWTAEHRELDSVLVRNGIPEVAGVDHYEGAKTGLAGTMVMAAAAKA